MRGFLFLFILFFSYFFFGGRSWVLRMRFLVGLPARLGGCIYIYMYVCVCVMKRKGGLSVRGLNATLPTLRFD